MRHARERQHSGNRGGDSDINASPRVRLALQLARQDDYQLVRRSACLNHQIASREVQILGIGRKPLELILLEIFENRNLAESLNKWSSCDGRHNYTLLRY